MPRTCIILQVCFSMWIYPFQMYLLKFGPKEGLLRRFLIPSYVLAQGKEGGKGPPKKKKRRRSNSSSGPSNIGGKRVEKRVLGGGSVERRKTQIRLVSPSYGTYAHMVEECCRQKEEGSLSRTLRPSWAFGTAGALFRSPLFPPISLLHCSLPKTGLGKNQERKSLGDKNPQRFIRKKV